MIYLIITQTMPYGMDRMFKNRLLDRTPINWSLFADRPQLADFLEQLLQYEEVDRPSAAQALQHEWILGGEE